MTVSLQEPATAPDRRLRGPDGPQMVAGERLDLDDVHRFGALGTGLLLVGDLGALGQRAVAIAVDAAEVHEQVATTVVRRDEPEPLVVAEPFDRTRCHENPFVFPVVQAKARPDRGKRTRVCQAAVGIFCAQRPRNVARPGPWSRNERTAAWRSSEANSAPATCGTRSLAISTPPSR